MGGFLILAWLSTKENKTVGQQSMFLDLLPYFVVRWSMLLSPDIRRLGIVIAPNYNWWKLGGELLLHLPSQTV